MLLLLINFLSSPGILGRVTLARLGGHSSARDTSMGGRKTDQAFELRTQGPDAGVNVGDCGLLLQISFAIIVVYWVLFQGCW